MSVNRRRKKRAKRKEMTRVKESKKLGALEQLAEIQKRANQIDEVLSGENAYLLAEYPPYLACSHLKKRGVDISKLAYEVFPDLLIASFVWNDMVICIMVNYSDSFKQFCMYYGGEAGGISGTGLY